MMINFKIVYFLCKVWNYPLDGQCNFFTLIHRNKSLIKICLKLEETVSVLVSGLRKNPSQIMISLSIYSHTKSPWPKTHFLFFSFIMLRSHNCDLIRCIITRFYFDTFLYLIRAFIAHKKKCWNFLEVVVHVQWNENRAFVLNPGNGFVAALFLSLWRQSAV